MRRLTPYHRLRLVGCVLMASLYTIPYTFREMVRDARERTDSLAGRAYICAYATIGLLLNMPRLTLEAIRTLWSDYEAGAL